MSFRVDSPSLFRVQLHLKLQGCNELYTCRKRPRWSHAIAEEAKESLWMRVNFRVSISALIAFCSSVASAVCQDESPDCINWAAAGECDRNMAYSE
jgi:hypothetical protein